MKFEIKVRNTVTGAEWWEPCEEEFPMVFRRNTEINSVEEYGPKIVEYFNSTLREGESPREFLELKILEEDE